MQNADQRRQRAGLAGARIEMRAEASLPDQDRLAHRHLQQPLGPPCHPEAAGAAPAERHARIGGRIALPVWTVLLGFGQVLPLPLAIVAPGRVSAAALALSIAPRLILAWRFGQPVWSALAHPVGIATLLAAQWRALIRAALGRPAVWRGRAYAP